jgi:hypothetical protein
MLIIIVAQSSLILGPTNERRIAKVVLETHDTSGLDTEWLGTINERPTTIEVSSVELVVAVDFDELDRRLVFTQRGDVLRGILET